MQILDKITPNLWYDGKAEEAAEFYVSLFPNSRIESVQRAAADNPSSSQGDVLIVEFTLAGRRFVGINGSPAFAFSEAVSFQILCEDQAEVDRYWEAFTGDGGIPGRCGWCKDKFGLSWQVTPRRLFELLSLPDRAAAARTMQAMLQMSRIDISALERAANSPAAN